MKLISILLEINKKLKYDLAYLKSINIATISDDELRDILNVYKNRDNVYYSSAEYRSIYPHLSNISKELKRRFIDAGESAMKSMGLQYGDRVSYDFPEAGIFMTQRAEGVLSKSAGGPIVKLDRKWWSGNKKTIRWNKGWKKI